MKKFNNLKKDLMNYPKKLKRLSRSQHKKINNYSLKKQKQKKAKFQNFKTRLSTKTIKYGSYKNSLKRCMSDMMNSHKKTMMNKKFSLYNKK